MGVKGAAKYAVLLHNSLAINACIDVDDGVLDLCDSWMRHRGECGDKCPLKMILSLYMMKI